MIEKLLVGTYTHKNSEGLYELELDTDAKKLQNLTLVGRSGNPTYLVQSKANKVYAIDAESADGKKIGGLKAFDASTRPFTEIGKYLADGTSPAYVTVDEARQLVYTANYHMGVVTVYKIAADGTLTQTDQAQHTGNGPRPEQQDGPHPHFADLTPDNRIVVCDLGNDTVYVYDVTDAGKLTEVSRFSCEDGFGPRHIVFNPETDKAYLAGELSSKVSVLSYDCQTGNFSLDQTIKTIPNTWTEHNGAAAIRITSDHKYVYVSNRGFNSLATLAIQSDGSVKLIDQTPAEGDFPRDFNFNSDESFIVLVNQNTDNATLYSRDAASGKLTMVQKDVQVPEGVCVKFEY